MTNISLKTLLYILPAVILFACAKETKPRVTSKDELYLFLDTLERRYDSACSALESARWSMFGSRTTEDPTWEARNEIAAMFLDTSVRNIITEWRNRSGSLADKPLARRLEMWHRAFLGGSVQFDREISGLKHISGPSIGASDKSYMEAAKKLRAEKNRKKRRASWLSLPASTPAHAEQYREYVKLLNSKARENGFPNYYSMILYLDGVDEARLLSTFEMLAELTQPEYEKFLLGAKKKHKLKAVEPWDIDFITPEQKQLPDRYFAADRLEESLNSFLDSIGFKTEDLKITVETAGGFFSPACYKISIPKDIRVRLGRQGGSRYYCEAFGAYEVALRAALSKADYPIFKPYNIVSGTYSISYDRGLAGLLAEIPGDSAWLRKFTKVKEKELKQFHSRRSESGIMKLRGDLKSFRSEYEFYKNPDADPDSLERSMFAEYFGVTVDSSAATPFRVRREYFEQPGSYYVGIFQKLISAQIQEVLADRFGTGRYSDSTLARWFTEHLYSGNEKLEWQERMRNSTGKSVEPGPFLRKIGIEHSVLLSSGNNR